MSLVNLPTPANSPTTAKTNQTYSNKPSLTCGQQPLDVSNNVYLNRKDTDPLFLSDTPTSPIHESLNIRSDQPVSVTSPNGTVHMKPREKYAQLICQAFAQSINGKLSLAMIYEYLTKTYPFFEHCEMGWQNSVRYNLTKNDSFIKLPAPLDVEGRGKSYWTVTVSYLNSALGSNPPPRSNLCPELAIGPTIADIKGSDNAPEIAVLHGKSLDRVPVKHLDQNGPRVPTLDEMLNQIDSAVPSVSIANMDMDLILSKSVLALITSPTKSARIVKTRKKRALTHTGARVPRVLVPPYVDCFVYPKRPTVSGCGILYTDQPNYNDIHWGLNFKNVQPLPPSTGLN